MIFKHLTTSILCLITAISFAQIPQDSLLLFYPFDGNANDGSSNGFDGTVYGATLTTDRFGNPNSAYFFDGNNDYVEMPNTTILQPDFPVSISFWTKPVTLNQTDNQYFSRSPVTGNYAGITFNTTSSGSGGVNVNYGDNQGGSNVNYRRTKTASNGLTIGEWHHIVGILSGPNDMDIYIDGVLQTGYYSGNGSYLAYANVAGCVGRANTSTAYHLGAIDDFAVYNKSLDSCEVHQLYTLQNCRTIAAIENEIAEPNNFKLYPNPSNGNFYFENPLNQKIDITIYDNTGKLVLSRNSLNEEKIVINENLEKGLYHLVIIDEKGIKWTNKLIIE